MEQTLSFAIPIDKESRTSLGKSHKNIGFLKVIAKVDRSENAVDIKSILYEDCELLPLLENLPMADSFFSEIIERAFEYSSQKTI